MLPAFLVSLSAPFPTLFYHFSACQLLSEALLPSSHFAPKQNEHRSASGKFMYQLTQHRVEQLRITVMITAVISRLKYQ
jgi:hypothetical protein